MASGKLRVRRGDVVQVVSGKDRGKRGKVLETNPKEGRVIVENLNVVKRHRRARPMKDASRMGRPQIQPGGVFDVANPVSASNVMLVCPACDRPTRIGFEFRDSKEGVVKMRVCRRADCLQVVDR